MIIPAICFCLIGAACNGAQSDATETRSAQSDTSVSPMAVTSLKLQKMTLTWKGQEYSREFICSPTVFPIARRGGGDPFSGSAGATQAREEKMGASPTPQWMRLNAGDDQLLIRLACHDQWRGQVHIVQDATQGDRQTLTPSEASELYQLTDGAGLIPVPEAAIDISAPRSISDQAEAVQIVKDQMSDLKPLSSILRVFPDPGLSDPILYRVTKSAPDKEPKPFPSRPWRVSCQGKLSELNIGGSQSYHLASPDMFQATPGMENCKLIRRFDNGPNGDDYAKSPYMEKKFGIDPTTPIHLLTEDEQNIFIFAHRISLAQPELFLHHGRAFPTKDIQKDPFLKSDFFQKDIKPAIEDF